MNVGNIINIRSSLGEVIISLELLEIGKNSSKVLVLHSRRPELIGKTETWGNKTLKDYDSLENSYVGF